MFNKLFLHFFLIVKSKSAYLINSQRNEIDNSEETVGVYENGYEDSHEPTSVPGFEDNSDLYGKFSQGDGFQQMFPQGGWAKRRMDPGEVTMDQNRPLNFLEHKELNENGLVNSSKEELSSSEISNNFGNFSFDDLDVTFDGSKLPTDNLNFPITMDSIQSRWNEDGEFETTTPEEVSKQSY